MKQKMIKVAILIVLAIVIIVFLIWLVTGKYQFEKFFQIIPSSKNISQDSTLLKESSPPVSSDLINQTCSEEFYQSMEALSGLRRDSKFSEWKADCFEKIIDIKEGEFAIIYSQTIALLFECYPGNLLNGPFFPKDDASFEQNILKLFGQHLLCEVYRNGNKDLYEKTRQDFLRAYEAPEQSEIAKRIGDSVKKALSKESPLSKVSKDKEPVGGCSEIIGEEFVKTKEYFCRAVFSKYYLYPSKIKE
ncbi:MAG: hypothetical protein PHW15_03105 [Patescibacteria group bacterium]|nr:hypothetical protein [Patescibacteria group bacterium]